MINYLLELSIIHVVLIIGYWIFLRKEYQYAKMRFFLIGSTLLALTIPFLKLPKLLFNSPQPVVGLPLESVPLDAFSVNAASEPSGFELYMLLWPYAIVSFLLLIKFVGNIGYLLYLERHSSYEKFNDLCIRKIAHIKGSFTFFNWIFLNEDIDRNQQDYDVILRHEKAHALLGHTYDLIFFELFKVCFWWLPSAWFINKEIKKIHEYQADAYALKTYSIDQYSSILISSTLKSNGLSLASSFHDGLILKRLIAMKQQAKNVSPWKTGALLALCALLFVAFACSEELDKDIKKMGEVNNAITFDQLPAEMQANLNDIKDKLIFTKLEIENSEVADIKRSLANAEELKNLDPNTIHSINVDKQAGAVFIAIKKEGANFDYIAEKSKMDGDVFTIVEKRPEYPGGMDAFYKMIGENIEYPEEARKNGVEGRVYVQFIIETDGAVSEVTTVKGIGAGCDAEAIRVVKNSPNFIPGSQRGKPVRVRMVMPVVFTLSDDTSTEGKGLGMIKTEQVQTDGEQLKVEANYHDGEWIGKVYSPEGNALPGANIVVAGTHDGTVSDLDGSFKMKADPSKYLHVSFLGYQSVQVKSE